MLEFWHNSAWKTLGTGDFLSLNREEKTQAEHILTFSIAVDGFSDSVAYAKGDRVALRNDGRVEFVGTIRKKQRSESAITFTAYNVWWYFLNITHEVDWSFVSTAYSASHITLCRDQNGDEHTAGWQIKKAILRAQDQGAPVLYVSGDLDLLDVVPPTSEVYDQTCAEIITTELGWYPNTAMVFEYPDDPSGGTTLRFLRSDSAEAVDITIGSDNLTGLSISENETTVKGVKIVYEVTTAIIGGETTEIIEDTAGTQSGPGVLVLTKDTDDGSYVESTDWSTEHSMNLVVGTMPTSWSDAWSSGFIAANDSYNNFGGRDVISLLSTSPSLSDLGYTKYVVSGWDNDDGYGIESETVNFTVYYKFKKNNIYYEAWAVFTLRLTNASSGTYTYTETGTDQEIIEGESMPEGGAGQLLLAYGGQIYSGSATLYDEAAKIHKVGAQKLNIFGGETGWETMDAVVQTLNKNYLTNIISFSFGRESHLSPDDFISFLRLGRQINRPNRDR
jgi:hypothetical protein